jgi:hypothetical protein
MMANVEEHFQIRKNQKQLSDNSFENCNPSKVTNVYWIYATRLKGEYPEFGENSGKWLIFANIDAVDFIWEKIKLATENGLLGSSSKVATARPNPNASGSKIKVICVYTYDYSDKEDVMRIRKELRKLGIENKIPYKTDNATRQNQYSVNGNTRISMFYE